MSDLINRNAMLKHIEKTRQDALMIDDICESNIIMRAMNLLEEVVRNQPSAQSEIIRCKDCKYRPKIAEGCDANDYTNSGFALDFPNDFKCPCRCEDPYYSWMPDDNWFCANGKRWGEI